MIITFDLDALEHIKEISFYNNNYYKLPYSINGCGVLYNEFDEGTNSDEYYFGDVVEGKFVKKIWFYGDDGVVDLIKNRLG